MSVTSNRTPAHIYKIVIAGPVGAGKTQATSVLSDKEIVSTEAKDSSASNGDKQTITVAMDYGTMKLDSGAQVHIYGTPGHKRFDFMWDILSENALGLILLISAEEANPVAQLQSYLESFMPLMQQNAVVVGITHTENAPADLHQRVSDYLMSINLSAEVMLVDARDRAQMLQVVQTLIGDIER
mgnify:FL=1